MPTMTFNMVPNLVCIYVYNIRRLQLTLLWELDYPQLTVYVRAGLNIQCWWRQAEQAEAMFMSTGVVTTGVCRSVAYRWCERIVEWGSCSCAWCRRYGSLKGRITWPFESMDVFTVIVSSFVHHTYCPPLTTSALLHLSEFMQLNHAFWFQNWCTPLKSQPLYVCSRVGQAQPS